MLENLRDYLDFYDKDFFDEDELCCGFLDAELSFSWGRTFDGDIFWNEINREFTNYILNCSLKNF